jgi:cholest-4-en-3-one 26-monooxygenase
MSQLVPQCRIDDPALYTTRIPHDVYDLLREGEPVHFNSGPLPFYAVLRHAEALKVLQDAGIFSSARQGILIEDTSPELRPVMRAMLPVLDSPAHKALRQKLLPPLLPEQLASLKPSLESALDAVVVQAVRTREVEFVHGVAAEVPLIAFGLLMGLERAELEPLRAPADAIIERGINHSTAEVRQLCDHLDALVADRQARPRDDYMTRLAQVDLDDQPLTRLERNGMLLQIAIGGLETARSAIAGLMSALLDFPDQWESLRADPSIIPNAVEESLRYVSPVNYLRRTTTQATRVAGVELPADARVVVFLSAANRDPARFRMPHTLDLKRNNARQHLALGSGSHFCMGAWLGKIQLASFWSAFVHRVRAISLAGPLVRRPTVQQNLILALPLRLDGDAT